MLENVIGVKVLLYLQMRDFNQYFNFVVKLDQPPSEVIVEVLSLLSLHVWHMFLSSQINDSQFVRHPDESRIMKLSDCWLMPLV